jgi:ubiquinone/menaquinone biosynthesis C-methylase UbiE
MDDSRFDFDEVFDEDYLHFYEALLTPERTKAAVDLIWKVMALEPGMRVLDLACGHGRIANRLAARGLKVTGLDASPRFLDLAREDAKERGVEVAYVRGDMRAMPEDWTGRFDRVVNWFTAFGYFSDQENRTVLKEAARVLRARGTLLIEMANQPFLFRHFQPESVVERDGDWMIDRRSYNPVTGRIEETRTIIRGGRSRTLHFFVRLLSIPELRDWLLDAGFSRVDALGEGGGVLTSESRRALTLATR